MKPTLSCLSLALVAAVGLSACGGGDRRQTADPAQISDAASAAQQSAARTAPGIPVIPQQRYAASGVESYSATVERYNKVGEALHGQ